MIGTTMLQNKAYPYILVNCSKANEMETWFWIHNYLVKVFTNRVEIKCHNIYI